MGFEPTLFTASEKPAGANDTPKSFVTEQKPGFISTLWYEFRHWYLTKHELEPLIYAVNTHVNYVFKVHKTEPCTGQNYISYLNRPQLINLSPHCQRIITAIAQDNKQNPRMADFLQSWASLFAQQQLIVIFKAFWASKKEWYAKTKKFKTIPNPDDELECEINLYLSMYEMLPYISRILDGYNDTTIQPQLRQLEKQMLGKIEANTASSIPISNPQTPRLS